VTGDVNRMIGQDYNRFQEQAAFDETQGRSRELIGGAKGLYDQAMNDPEDFVTDMFQRFRGDHAPA
jgi:hypothetical protein